MVEAKQEMVHPLIWMECLLSTKMLIGEKKEELDEYLDSIKITADNRGPFTAFQALRECITLLWNHPSSSVFRQKLKLGFIKDTDKYGTSSVSMGVAVQHALTLKPNTRMVMLNCGSGGMKVQVYAKGPFGIYREFELEKRPDVGSGSSRPSPNAVKIGCFEPSEVPAGWLGTPASYWHDVWASDRVKCEALLLELKAELTHRNIDYWWTFAFVTGACRSAWQKAGIPQKLDMETDIKRYFQPFSAIPCSPANDSGERQSFFMSQKVESCMEQLATFTMYSNVKNAGLIDSGTTLVDTWGVGMASVQMSNFLAELGMKKPDILKTQLPLQFQAALPKGFIAGYESEMQTWDTDDKIPVIALKSGFAILFEEDENLRNILLRRNEEVTQRKNNIRPSRGGSLQEKQTPHLTVQPESDDSCCSSMGEEEEEEEAVEVPAIVPETKEECANLQHLAALFFKRKNTPPQQENIALTIGTTTTIHTSSSSPPPPQSVMTPESHMSFSSSSPPPHSQSVITLNGEQHQALLQIHAKLTETSKLMDALIKSL